jgi:hypothetical protein
MNVFISRPTWVPEPYEEGLNSFIEFLKKEEFDPHTLGTTDFPVDSPLDEVINLMEKSSGVIVLGYPQIKIQKGLIKDEQVKNKHLPTEWNQIEGVLAYSLKKPLLIMHDKGISRGIFDRGAINKFIHEVDLREVDWFLNTEIEGAIYNWKSKIKEPVNFYEKFPIYERNHVIKKPSEEGLELLKSAVNNQGFISIIEVGTGYIIETLEKEFSNGKDRRAGMRWKSKIQELEDLGFIEPKDYKRNSFEVSNKGYDIIEKKSNG